MARMGFHVSSGERKCFLGPLKLIGSSTNAPLGLGFRVAGLGFRVRLPLSSPERT